MTAARTWRMGEVTASMMSTPTAYSKLSSEEEEWEEWEAWEGNISSSEELRGMARVSVFSSAKKTWSMELP